MINWSYKHEVPEEIKEWLIELTKTLPKGYTAVMPNGDDPWSGIPIEPVNYRTPQYKPNKLYMFIEKDGPADSTTDSCITIGIAWDECDKSGGSYPEL